ncbi:MAG TPA: hypothetical protein VGW74_02910, partial [Propionibacteriaceae bacterium]|nr:hypothetical protein [Propionibacteriaceae bacterium]
IRVSAADETVTEVSDPQVWWDLVPRTPVLVDTRHRFLVAERRTATHLRLDVYPDGGLTRLRCFGELPEDVRMGLYERFWESLPVEHQQFLTKHSNDPLPRR